MTNRWITIVLYHEKTLNFKYNGLIDQPLSEIKTPPGAEIFLFTKHQYIYIDFVEEISWDLIKKIKEKYNVELKNFSDWFYYIGKNTMKNNIQKKFYDKESYIKELSELDVLALEDKTNNSLLSVLKQENIKLF